MPDFTDEELLAYADERLVADPSSQIERQLRSDQAFADRLKALLSQRDQGAQTLGEVWRRDRLSCPPRAVWAALIDGRLGDGLTQYLHFHLETVGCRICAANRADLERPDTASDAQRRAKKIFQSSAGRLGQS